MSTDTHLSTVALKLSSWAAALAMLAGIMVLVGWAFDIAALKSVLPVWVAMKANTAVCFILIGVALWLAARQQFGILIVRLCLLLTGLIGLLTLAEYIFDWNTGLDLWLFYETNGAVGTSYPGRMAPEAAFSFVLLAAALWITGSSHQTRWTVLAAVNVGLLVTALALAAMLSYLTPGIGSYGWFGLTIMAMHTTILFVVLGMAVMAISWRQEMLPWSLGRNTTAAFACGIVLLVLIGFNMNRSQFWLDEANRKITSSEEVLSNIANVQLELASAQAHARGYVITGEKGFMDDYLEDISAYHVKMDALRLRIAGSPEQQQQLSLIETNVDLLRRWTQQFIDVPRTSVTRRKIDVHDDKLLEIIHDTFAQIEDEHLRLIRELRQESDSVTRFAYFTTTAGTFVSMLIFLTVMFRLNFAVSERKRAEKVLHESEAEFHTLAEAMPQIVWITRANGWNIYFNQQWMDYTGLTLEESRGHGWNKPFHPDDQQRAWDAWQLAVTGRDIYSIESRLRRADGVYRWWLVRGVPLLDADGNILKWFGTCTDIHDLKIAGLEITRANAELRESERRFSDLLENVELVSVMLDSEERITYCNEFLLRLTGWKYEEIIGRNWVELFVPPEIAEQKKKVVAELILDKPEARHYESEILTRSGERRLIRWNHSVLRSGDGDVIGTASIGENITEHKQAESRLSEQLEELRRWHEVTSGREERILDLKHEVNNLLNQTGKYPRYLSAEPQDKTEK